MKKLIIYLSFTAFFAPYALAMQSKEEPFFYRAPSKPSPNWAQHGGWEEQFPHAEPMKVKLQTEPETSQEYKIPPTPWVDWAQQGSWKD